MPSLYRQVFIDHYAVCLRNGYIVNQIRIYKTKNSLTFFRVTNAADGKDEDDTDGPTKEQCQKLIDEEGKMKIQ